MMNIEDFLTARFEDDTTSARQWLVRLVNAPAGSWQDWVRSIGKRMLVDAETKRRIVALHQPWPEPYADGIGCERCNSQDDVVTVFPEADHFPCETLRLLAAPYSWHPDFDPAWKLPVG